jgi:hypothetical protein
MSSWLIYLLEWNSYFGQSGIEFLVVDDDEFRFGIAPL